MDNVFVEFTEEEYQKYSEMFNYNTELEDGKIRVWGGEDSSLTLVKHWKGDIYIEVEGEGGYLEDGDDVYVVDPIWWTKLNWLDTLVEDVKDGEELYYSNYQ